MTKSKLRIRKATKRDCVFLWKLRNEAVVRKNSINSKPIKLKEHRDWFLKALKNQDLNLFVAANSYRRLGQLRIEKLKQGLYEMHIAISPKFRFKGSGQSLLKMGLSRLKKTDSRAKRVIAFTKPQNAGALRCFQNAGFRLLPGYYHRKSVKLRKLVNDLK